MKAFIFAALVAVAFAQPGNISDDAGAISATENDAAAPVDNSEIEAPPVAPPVADPVADEPYDANYNIEQATNFKDNAAAKGAKTDYDWSAMNLSEFNFKDLMDLLNSDAATGNLAGRVKEEFKEYYVEQVKNLPPVCNTKCREDIRAEAMLNVKAEWEATLIAIKDEIQATLVLSQNELDTAYTNASLCAHGCECQFIENRYSEIKANIELIEESIAEKEGQIDVIQGQIDEAEVAPCDFSDIEEEYVAKWDAMQASHDDQIAALGDWLSDGFEMSDMVDKDAFSDAYGFEYDSSRFDAFYQGEANLN